MTVHHGKLLELEAIEKKYDKYFLHVKLSFDQDIKMIWEIDKYTAENLNTIISFGKGHRYRLSLNSSWDVIQKQHISILTQTYLEQSDRIYFSCSGDFINKLTAVKHSQNVDDLDMLNFTSINLSSVKSQDNVGDQIQTEDVQPRKYNHKFTRTSIAIMAIIFAISFGLLGRVYVNNTILGEEALAGSIELDNEMHTEQNESIDSRNNTFIESIHSNEPIIPFVKLDQAITYSIPKGSVALTFDDGPSRYSTEIMDVLKKYGVGGTFFFTGRNVMKYPDHIQYIKSNGYSIGSHSMNHISMPTLSYEKQENEIIEAGKLLEEITKEKTTLFRPPYGAFNQITKDLMGEHQYKIVLWDNDPKDWETRDADRIFNDIQTLNISGSIILLHESQAVIDALPRIIEYLKALDLQIISLQ